MPEKFTPEKFFLRYVFPGKMNELVEMNITKAEYETMRFAFETGSSMLREFLERVYPKIIIALSKHGGDYWTVAVMRDYFWREHNDTVPAEYSVELRELCEIWRGTLVEVQSTNKFIVLLNTGTKRAVTTAYPDAKVGDVVMVHYGYAVEKVG